MTIFEKTCAILLLPALATIASAQTQSLVNWFALITKVNGSRFQVLTNPGKTDPQSAYKQENKTILVNANTVFEASAREDLKAGRDVQVIGRPLANGEILATRVTVYQGNHPVRMRKDARIVLPNGSVK